MNKMHYLQLLLCILPAYAIPPSVAAFMATTPVTVPATYYWYKTKKAQASCGKYCDHNIHEMRAPFLAGALCGVIPPINVLCIGGAIFLSPCWLPDVLFSQEKYFTKSDTAGLVGFISGVSLYATIPLALEYARKGVRR